MTAFDSDELLKRFLERTIGADSELAAQRLAQAPVPAGVKAYLRAHLRERLREELGQAPSFNRVRVLSPSAARLQQLFIEQAADAYVYPREEFQADLENAVHFTENFVCRPRWTLSSFLFHTADVIPAADLFAKLDYVSDYVYLPHLLRKTIASRELQEIDKATCTDLIRRIDAAVVKEHAPRELAALARPLFAFFGADEPGAAGEVPLRPVLLFFEDKEMVGMKEYITGIYHFRNRETISLDDLAALCDDFLGASKETVPLNETEPAIAPPAVEAAPASQETSEPVAGEHADPVELPPVVEPTAAAHEEVPEEAPAEPLLPPAPDPTPAEIPAEELFIAPEINEEAPVDERPLPDLPEETDGPQDQLELLLPPPAPVRLPDLTTVITPEQRRRFVVTLCDRDADFYDLMIARLNEMRSWQDAKGYVREVFEINAIDPFLDEAIEFTDIVQQRFEPGTGPTA